MYLIVWADDVELCAAKVDAQTGFTVMIIASDIQHFSDYCTVFFFVFFFVVVCLFAD